MSLGAGVGGEGDTLQAVSCILFSLSDLPPCSSQQPCSLRLNTHEQVATLGFIPTSSWIASPLCALSPPYHNITLSLPVPPGHSCRGGLGQWILVCHWLPGFTGKSRNKSGEYDDQVVEIIDHWESMKEWVRASGDDKLRGRRGEEEREDLMEPRRQSMRDWTGQGQRDWWRGKYSWKLSIGGWRWEKVVEVKMTQGCLACTVGWTAMPLTKAFHITSCLSLAHRALDTTANTFSLQGLWNTWSTLFPEMQKWLILLFQVTIQTHTPQRGLS